MKKFKLFLFTLLSVMIVGITHVNAETCEAKIGSGTCKTLVEIVGEAKENDEIVLQSNVDLTSTFPSGAALYVELPDNVTLDLNGYSITQNNNSIRYAGNNLTLKNGEFIVKGYGTESTGDYSLFLGAFKVETSNYTLENLVLKGGLNVKNATGVELNNVTATGTGYYAVWADPGAEVTINSGNYSSASGTVLGVSIANDASLIVNGGNFTVGNGKLSCSSTNCKNPVVLGGAFDTIIPSENLTDDSNITIKLTKNIEMNNQFEVVGNVTLDLNGKTLTAANSMSGNGMFTVLRDGKLTINDETGKGKITVGENEDVYSVVMLTKKGESANGALAELVINGGTLEGYYYAVVGNGNRHDTSITINDGKLLGLNTEDNLGIYHPQSGTLTINGGEIIGLTGVEIRAGELIVTGGKITGTSNTLKAESNGSGSTSVGGGITIAQHTTKLAIDAKISGGEISGKEALYVVFPEANPNKDIVKVEVSGGTYNTDVKDYLGEKYITLKENNKYVVYEKHEIRFAILDNGDATLSKEFAAKGEEVIVTLAPNAGFELSKISAKANDNTAVTLTKVSDTEYKFIMLDDEVAFIIKFAPIQTTELPVVGEDAEVGVSNKADAEEVLLETLNSTTDTKLKEVLESTSVKVDVVVEEVKNTDEVSKKFEKALIEEKDIEDAKLVHYFDITISVKNAATNEEITTLTDLTKPIELMIEIPELEKVKEGYTRNYYIIREHDGEVTIIKDVELTEDGKYLVFASSEFSTYALAYNDTLDVKVPETGDNVLSFVTLGFISIGAIALLLNNLKKRELNR